MVRYNITLAGGSEEPQRRAGECERLQAVCSVECCVGLELSRSSIVSQSVPGEGPNLLWSLYVKLGFLSALSEKIIIDEHFVLQKISYSHLFSSLQICVPI